MKEGGGFRGFKDIKIWLKGGYYRSKKRKKKPNFFF